MGFNIYGDFDPNARQECGEYVEFSENDLCWGNDVDIPAGSYFRYSANDEWSFSKNDSRVYLCCSGDYFEVVEPGPPTKRTVYVVV